MKRFWTPVIIPLWASLALAAGPADKGTAEGKSETRPPVAFYDKYLSDDDPGDRAIRDLTAKAAEKPDDPGIHNDLGNLLARRGFAKEAAQQYRLAEHLDKASYLPSYNEGLLWEKEGKPSSAMSAFRRSIRRKPGFPFSHFHLGVLEEKEGHETSAVSELAKALRIDNSLRLPSRNPLAVQTNLLHRASVANYSRDLAAAVLVADGEFADPTVLARLSPERFLDSEDVEPREEEEPQAPAPVTVTVPQSAPAPAAAAPPAGRGGNRPGIFGRTRMYPRPRTQFPPQTAPAPVQAPPPPAAEVPPAENPENPPPPEEEPPPPPSR
ncbi:MAG: tetratricopeptide repeat protein [Thermoanaerobaculia bacterium]